MIIAKTPLRITLGGGGTDLKAWYKKNGGFLFALTINKFIYTTISKRFNDNDIWLSYSKNEVTKNIKDIKNEYIKACLKKFPQAKGIEIHSISDVPGKSGLGSSGSFLVGLNNCLGNFYKLNYSKKDLAEISTKIESEELKKNSGLQDHYMASFGGIKKLIISKNGNTKISNINISDDRLNFIQNNIFLYFSNQYRNASKILKNQQRNISTKKDVEKYMHKIQKIGFSSYECLIKGDLEKYSYYLNRHYDLKKNTSKYMSNNKLNDFYSYALENGATGGKNIGAGGGGVFLFYVPKKNQLRFKEKMSKINTPELKWKYQKNGSEIIKIK